MIGFTEIELQPGQFIYGRKKASKELRMSEQNTRTCLKSLEKSKNITIKPTNRYSIITVCKWDTYQNDINSINHHNNQQLTNNQPTTNQQLTTDKNVKNDNNGKKEKENIYMPFLDHWNSFKIIIHRKITDKQKTKINTALKNYEKQEILKAMENYSYVVKSSQHYFSHKWTLEDFLQRGLSKFVDAAQPIENFKEKSHGQGTGKKSNDRYYKRGGAAPRRGIEKLSTNN